MKNKFLVGAFVGTALVALAAKDPVLMNINGKDIRLSEFEYLYKKNSQQQIQQESLEQYVDRFVTYKLKVADAEAAKIDTSAAFKAEFEGYKADLVKPFLVDTNVNNRLVAEAYDRMIKNVDVDHIMLPVGKDKKENDKILERLDSIRNCVLNGEDFSELAKKFSIDPSVKKNGGHYGFIGAGMFPYVWEYNAYNTPDGQMCQPFRTDFGNHLLRTNAHRGDLGKVEVEHILILFPSVAQRKGTPTDEEKMAVKQRIDSIYAAIKGGANFEELAKAKSEDKSSAVKGGRLPFFGINQMVKEFEETAFRLNDGEISEPFETVYGYHIVKKLSHKGVPTLEESRGLIEQQMARDSRSTMARDAKIEELKKYYGYKENADFKNFVEKSLASHGQYDSAFVAGVLAKADVPLFTYAKNVSVPASELAKRVNPNAKLDNVAAVDYLVSQVEPFAKHELMSHYIDNIIEDNADYRNLINEYRDGMLLFEMSNRNVWEGASKDTVGLKNYFEANRSKYNWDSPHFKGIILSATNDSTATVAREIIGRLSGKVSLDSLTTNLHETLKSAIKMERMLVAKGENDVADRTVFGVDKENKSKYAVSFVIDGGIIEQPEDLADVKGLVTSDYQDVREKNWVEQLKKKYPVKIFKKVLKKIK